jgi:SagB-type dehydrogenase family enzyme
MNNNLDHPGHRFIELTKYENLSISSQHRGETQPSMEIPLEEKGEIIPLQPPDKLKFESANLQQIIEERRSIRLFDDVPMTLDELSYLLWCTQGVKEVVQGKTTLRTVPSAGARHAFETYLWINRVEGLEPGLYRYISSKHALVSQAADALEANDISAACLDQRMIERGALLFIWVAIPYRMTWRYAERGYRYLYLDAGHVCQNLYLAANPIKTGVCAIAAFDDDAMNKLLGLDGVNRFVIYCANVGKLKG